MGYDRIVEGGRLIFPGLTMSATPPVAQSDFDRLV